VVIQYLSEPLLRQALNNLLLKGNGDRGLIVRRGGGQYKGYYCGHLRKPSG